MKYYVGHIQLDVFVELFGINNPIKTRKNKNKKCLLDTGKLNPNKNEIKTKIMFIMFLFGYIL